MGFDFSAEAIEIARERAAKAGMRFSFVHAICHALVLQGRGPLKAAMMFG